MSLPGLLSRAKAIAALPPLGVLTLAGMTPTDWSVTLHETKSVTDELVHRIVSEAPTLVAISALTASILEGYALSTRLRAEGIAVVLGGLHVTALPEEAALHADAIVVGDGEPVWHQVLADAENGHLRARYRATAPFDLAHAPLPRFDLLGDVARPRFTLQTSRGCPFACDFCGASRLLGPFRTKPATRVRDELRAITARDPRAWIELADDNTFAEGGPHDDLLSVLGESGARWFTEADWRLGENPAVLERLAASGCVQVLVGLESRVHRHRGMGAKAAPPTRMMDAVEAIQAVGVAVIGCYIVGSDGETRESIQRLRRFLDRDPCADAQITLQTPFPGTALRQRLEDEQRLLADRDWSRHTLFDVTYRPDCMGAEELEVAFVELLRDAFGEEPTRRRHQVRRQVWRRHPLLCGEVPS
ncbi:MAG: B12-binding domain-containing radical SAM protein [Planctomycetes bacterium]|nr:B12-binding domain-containing radical SAM protein [Planctomycetota bacterium]